MYGLETVALTEGRAEDAQMYTGNEQDGQDWK